MNTRRSRPLLQQPTLQADGTQTQYILPTSSHSCHQCKTRRDPALLAVCSSPSCIKLYCRNCLDKYYRQPLPQGVPSWVCPFCESICVCSRCKRDRDLPNLLNGTPTVPHIVRKNKNVQNGQGSSVVKPRSTKKKSTCVATTAATAQQQRVPYKLPSVAAVKAVDTTVTSLSHHHDAPVPASTTSMFPEYSSPHHHHNEQHQHILQYYDANPVEHHLNYNNIPSSPQQQPFLPYHASITVHSNRINGAAPPQIVPTEIRGGTRSNNHNQHHHHHVGHIHHVRGHSSGQICFPQIDCAVTGNQHNTNMIPPTMIQSVSAHNNNNNINIQNQSMYQAQQSQQQQQYVTSLPPPLLPQLVVWGSTAFNQQNPQTISLNQAYGQSPDATITNFSTFGSIPNAPSPLQQHQTTHQQQIPTTVGSNSNIGNNNIQPLRTTNCSNVMLQHPQQQPQRNSFQTPPTQLLTRPSQFSSTIQPSQNQVYYQYMLPPQQQNVNITINNNNHTLQQQPTMFVNSLQQQSQSQQQSQQSNRLILPTLPVNTSTTPLLLQQPRTQLHHTSILTSQQGIQSTPNHLMKQSSHVAPSQTHIPINIHNNNTILSFNPSSHIDADYTDTNSTPLPHSSVHSTSSGLISSIPTPTTISPTLQPATSTHSHHSNMTAPLSNRFILAPNSILQHSSSSRDDTSCHNTKITFSQILTPSRHFGTGHGI